MDFIELFESVFRVVFIGISNPRDGDRKLTEPCAHVPERVFQPGLDRHLTLAPNDL